MNHEELRQKVTVITREPNLLSTNAPDGSIITKDYYPMTDAIMALFDDTLISEFQDIWALSDPIEGIRKRLFDKQPTDGDRNK